MAFVRFIYLPLYLPYSYICLLFLRFITNTINPAQILDLTYFFKIWVEVLL